MTLNRSHVAHLLTCPLPISPLLACNDSTQNWYHTLAVLRPTLEIVKGHWHDIDEASLQSDGAGNYSCTATMTSLPRVGEVAGVRITDHAITEVGDGKNLVDTDFQQVQMEPLLMSVTSLTFRSPLPLR